MTGGFPRTALLCVALLAAGVLAGWSVTPQVDKTYPITDALLNKVTNQINLQYIFKHTAVTKWAFEIERAGIFPDRCTGDIESKFGWNYWKRDLFFAISVSGDSMRMTLSPVTGFVAIKPEIVTCGPFTDKDTSKALYTGTLPPEDAKFSFVINSTTELPTVRLQVRNFAGSFVNVGLSPTIDEKVWRLNGIQLYITLLYDVWNATYVNDIASVLRCEPIEIDCFANIVQPRHFSIPSKMPNVVFLNVTRDEARLFNIRPITTPTPRDTKVAWRLPTEGSQKWTLKGLPIEQKDVEKETVITVTPWPYSPEIALSWKSPPPTRATLYPDTREVTDGVINMTENCLRGKALETPPMNDPTYTEPPCPRIVVFQTQRIPPQVQIFSRNPTYATEDTRRYAFTSQTNDFFRFNWVQTIHVEPIAQLKFSILINPLPEYETWVTDMISVLPPYTIFDILEPPVPSPKPMFLKIIPSPGRIYGIARNLTDRQIVAGGFTFEYLLDGESLEQAALDNFVNLLQSPNATDAWQTMKESCILPPGSVSFKKTAWGTNNQSHIIVKFQPCPDFETTYSDVITLAISDPSLVRSKLPLTLGPGLVFGLAKTSGLMVYLNTSTFHEANVRGGGRNFSFHIQLLSEKWPVTDDGLAACYNAICDFWNTSTVPVGGKDADSWANPARRQKICNGAFTKISERLVKFTGQPDDAYDTRKGENILVAVPAVCAVSGKPVEGNQSVRINPQSGFVHFAMCNTPDVPVYQLSEHQVRAGGFSLCVVSWLDNFDDEPDDPGNKVIFEDEIYRALKSTGIEAFGFNKKKATLIASRAVMESTRIVYTFRGDTSYDISVNETIYVNMSAPWMTSASLPTPTSLELLIYVSAGTVRVADWFGADGRVVTEDDLRWGRVWFDFSLLGDQWRRERTPFTKIWTGDLLDAKTDTFSTLASVSKLIPELEFFNFTVLITGHEILRLQLQSNEDFDVPRLETVTISFVAATVVSGIMPLFQLPGSTGLNDRVPTWAFTVAAVPGRVVLSGAVRGLDEKQLRRSTSIVWYLTLIGDTWAANVSTALAESIGSFNAEGNPSNAIQGFHQLKNSLLPTSRIQPTSATTMRLEVSPDRSFEITIDETISYDIGANLVESGLAPLSSVPLQVAIKPTGGELRLATSLSLTEDNLRRRNFTVDLALDGDQWNLVMIQQNLKDFIREGFGSQSPILFEPNGFLQNKDTLLRIGTDAAPVLFQQPDASAISIFFFPTASYDIDSDETITFSVTNTKYVSSATGDLPDPATVSFTVRAVSRTIIVIVDPNLAYTSTYQSQPRTMELLTADMLNLATGRLQASVNITARRPRDDLLVMRLLFVGSPTSSDARTVAELASTLMALNTAYLHQQIGARYVYFEDSPPPDSELYPFASAESVTTAPQEKSFTTVVIAVCSAAGFVVIAGIIFLLFMQSQRKHLAVGLTSSSHVEQLRDLDVGTYEEKADATFFTREEELRNATRAHKVKELANERRRLGDVAGARRIEREGILTLPVREKSGAPGSPDGESSSTSDGLAAADVLSGGRVVQRPMSMKQYVRRQMTGGQDDQIITAYDLAASRSRNVDDADDDDLNDTGSPTSRTGARSAKDGRVVHRESRERDWRSVTGGDPDALLPGTSRQATLSADGKTETELEDLRRRRTVTVQRRRAAVDALVDF
jgi:hypothetical protein